LVANIGRELLIQSENTESDFGKKEYLYNIFLFTYALKGRKWINFCTVAIKIKPITTK